MLSTRCLKLAIGTIATALLLCAGNPQAQPSPTRPRPRESVKHHRQSTNNQKADGYANSSPVASETPQPNSSNVTERDKNETQAVRVVPPIPQLNVNGSLVRDRFDYALPVLTLILAIIAIIQARLFYWTYVAQYRPRLEIRYLTLLNDPEDLFGVPLNVALVLINRGNSGATIVEGNVTLRVNKIKSGMQAFLTGETALPEFDARIGLPVYGPARDVFVGSKIRGGQRMPVERSLSVETAWDKADAYLATHPSRNDAAIAFYVFGFFKYRDWTRRYYTMGFCRKWDTKKAQFVPVYNCNYEYED